MLWSLVCFLVSFFFSFFLGFRRPNLISGLSGWQAPVSFFLGFIRTQKSKVSMLSCHAADSIWKNARRLRFLESMDKNCCRGQVPISDKTEQKKEGSKVREALALVGRKPCTGRKHWWASRYSSTLVRTDTFNGFCPGKKNSWKEKWQSRCQNSQ